MENSFDLLSANFEVEAEKTTQAENRDISLVCEAVQIVRLVKTIMTTRRDIIDTIKVDGAKMTYERALKIAKMKAEKIGNCLIIEKLERVVDYK
jgi:hypothetical protein